MVREVLKAGGKGKDGGPERWEDEWLASWLMVVGSVVDLRE